jgi:hypothetical protein
VRLALRSTTDCAKQQHHTIALLPNRGGLGREDGSSEDQIESAVIFGDGDVNREAKGNGC